MANFDFKAATPATLTTAGFLFGATSQGAATPSIFTTTFTGTGALVCGTSPSLTTPAIGVATATSLAVNGASIGSNALAVTGPTTLNEAVGSSALTLTGATQTTSQPVLNATQTWNSSGVTFTGIKINVTDTASASGSLFIDFQVGGSSKINIRKDGNIITLGAVAATAGFSTASGAVAVAGTGGSTSFQFNGNSYIFGAATGAFTFSNWDGSAQSTITIPASASFQFGAADAASPVAQTLQVQSVVAGTADTAGGNWTLKASKSTGAGVPGDIIFQTSGKGAASTTQNTLITALTIKGGTTNNTNVGQPSIVIGNAAIATNATDGFLYITTCAGTPTGTPTTFTGRVALCYDTTNHQLWVYDGGWLQPKTPAAAAVVTWQ